MTMCDVITARDLLLLLLLAAASQRPCSDAASPRFLSLSAGQLHTPLIYFISPAAAAAGAYVFRVFYCSLNFPP